MPNNNGILGGLGNFFGSIAGSMNPALQQNQWRQQGYNYLSDQLGDPGEAALYMSDPNAINAAWQRQLFVQQLQGLMGPDPNNPRMSLNEALYRMSPEAQKQQYGVTPVPGFKSASGAEAPGIITHGQLQGPSGFNTPQPVGTAVPQNAGGANGVTATQGQGGSPGPLSPADQAGVDYFATKKGAEDRASAEAKAQPGLPNVITDANTTLQQIHDLQNHPGLDISTGAVFGRAPGISGPQNDFVQKYNALLDSTFFQTLQQAKAGGGRTGANAAAALKASGRLLDPMSRTLPSDAFRKLLQDTADSITQYKKDAWYNAGKPKDLETAANSFSPKTTSGALPQIGEVRRGYTFLGGNPADQKSWQKQ